ncbi:MAG: hypothetical protein ACJ77E_07045 [Gaiellaceae bacterium]
MATHDIAIDGADGPASIACTLTAAGLATQSKRWQQLRGRAMIDRVETAHGLRISFRSEPGVEDELRELVAVEKGCCSWAEWTVETSPERIVLDVRSTGEGTATLHSMFTGPAGEVLA